MRVAQARRRSGRLRCLLLPLLLVMCLSRCCLPASAADSAAPPSPPARSWDEAAVQRWLSAVGLSDYSSVFSREAIDGDALMDLTQEEMTGALGISKLGHRKRVEKEIAKLQQAAGTAAAVAAEQQLQHPQQPQQHQQHPPPHPARASEPVLPSSPARPRTPAPSSASSSRPAAAAGRPLSPAPAAADFEAAAAASQAKKRKRKKKQQSAGGSSPQKPRTTADPASRHPLAQRSSKIVHLTDAQRAAVRDALRDALALHQSGELSRARQLYETVLGIDPQQARALHMLGLIVMVADGDLPAAISLLERSIELSDDADTHVNLANFFWQAGQREQAMAHWEYALQLQSLAGGVATRARYADTAYTVAMEAYNAGDVERCKQLLIVALRLTVESELLHYPVDHYPPPHQDGAAAFRQSNLQLTHAIRMTQADTWLHLGILYEQEDELALALVCYQRGLQVQPDPLDEQQPQHLQLATIRSETLNYRMQLLSRTRQMEDSPLSKQRLRQAEDEADGLSVDRGLQRHKKLVEYLHKSCHWSAAQRLAQLIMDDAIFHSPAYRFLFDNSTQIIEERQRYDAALTELLDDSMAGLWSQPLGLEWCRFRFYLAYHGLNDRLLNEKLAQVYLHLAPSLAYTAPHLRPGQLVRYDGSRKIRVGFISAFLTYHPVGRTLQGYIQHLPRSRFEVTVFFITLQPNVEHDSLLLQMQRWADHFVPLPVERTQQAREMVEQYRPDVLLYGDIGMEPTSFFLAFSRLAPVQALTFGHPDTSGLSTMDYFLSHPDMDDPQRGQEFYTERLVQLPGIGFWHKADLPARFLTREDVGLADHQLGLPTPPLADGAQYAWTMYLVTKSIQFYSPDFMDCVARILHAHPASFVAMVVDIGRQSRGFDLHNECQETILSGIESRLHALDSEQSTSAAVSSPPVPILQRQRLSGRVRFIDKGDHDYFMSLLRMTDVLLQPMPLDGTTTTLEAVSIATPTVLYEGPMIGGRMGSAIYRHMRVTDCIATSRQQYVDIALRLGTDRHFAQQLRQQVADNRELHRVFQDERAVHALADWMQLAVSQAL